MRAQGARLGAARFAAGFKSARSAALEFEWPESTYGAHEGGRRTIGQDDAEKYAKAFRARGAQVDAQKILFGSDRDQTAFHVDETSAPKASESSIAPPSTFARATFGGIVEAGAFREVGEFDDPDREPDIVPRDDRFPNATYFVFEVAGDSMNAADPPMRAGDRVVAVALEHFRGRLTLRTGHIVVIERSKDDGAYRERSVKQLELDQNETRFCPRSTNQRHKPIVVPKDHEPDDATKVEILAVVIDVMSKVRMP